MSPPFPKHHFGKRRGCNEFDSAFCGACRQDGCHTPSWTNLLRYTWNQLRFKLIFSVFHKFNHVLLLFLLPVILSGDPFWASRGPKRSKRVTAVVCAYWRIESKRGPNAGHEMRTCFFRIESLAAVLAHNEVADLSPKNMFGNMWATDGTYGILWIYPLVN